MAASKDLLKLFLKFSISERLFVSSFDFYFSCRIVGCLGLVWFGLPCLALSCLALSGLVLAHLALPSAAGVAASKGQLDRLLARRCPARRGCRLGHPTPGASGRPPRAPPQPGPRGPAGPLGLAGWLVGASLGLLGAPWGGPRGIPRPLQGAPGGGSWSYSGTLLEEYSDCPPGASSGGCSTR